jgi:hypothetical protein
MHIAANLDGYFSLNATTRVASQKESRRLALQKFRFLLRGASSFLESYRLAR